MDIDLVIRRINDLAKEKNISIPTLAASIGLTRSGLNKMLNRGDLKVSNLLLIAEKLGVTPDHFFDISDSSNQMKDIERKDRAINELKLLTKQVEILSDQAKIVKKMFGIEP